MEWLVPLGLVENTAQDLLTFAELYPLHDFLEDGQHHTQSPIFAPASDSQTGLLSNLSGCATDLVRQQGVLPLDDIGKV